MFGGVGILELGKNLIRFKYGEIITLKKLLIFFEKYDDLYY